MASPRKGEEKGSVGIPRSPHLLLCLPPRGFELPGESGKKLSPGIGQKSALILRSSCCPSQLYKIDDTYCPNELYRLNRTLESEPASIGDTGTMDAHAT